MVEVGPRWLPYVYIHIYVYVNMCIYVCLYIHISVLMYLYTYTYIYTHIARKQTRTYIYIYIYIYTYIYIYIYVYISIYIYLFIYIHLFVHFYIYMHIYIYTSSQEGDSKLLARWVAGELASTAVPRQQKLLVAVVGPGCTSSAFRGLGQFRVQGLWFRSSEIYSITQQAASESCGIGLKPRLDSRSRS